MEEVAVAVAEPAGRSLSSSSCGYGFGCEDKSRAARRRRMEIRRFKMLANAACNKRLRLSRHHGAVAAASYCNDKEEEEEEDEEENGSVTQSVKDRQVTEKEEKVTQSLPSSEGFVSALPSTSSGLASVDGDGDQCPPYGLVSICGGRREMEDALRVVPAFGCGADGVYHFFGVYDGHGGPQAAFYCKERLHEAMAEEIRLTDPKAEKEWKAVMKACFLKMDVEVAGLCGTKHLKTSPGCQGIKSGGEDFRQEPAATKAAPETVGSTAVVAVVGSRQIVVANCGDSRAVLSRGGRVIPLSTDHKPELAEEMARIEAAGGRVIYWNGYRVFGVLAMSRAIGDKYLKPYVIAEPELSFTARTAEDECLILASDGLWDVLSNEVVCEISRKCLAFRGRNEHVEGERDGTGGRRGGESGFESPAATAAALLTKLALARGSADNISVVVVDLRRPLSSPTV